MRKVFHGRGVIDLPSRQINDFFYKMETEKNSQKPYLSSTSYKAAVMSSRVYSGGCCNCGEATSSIQLQNVFSESKKCPVISQQGGSKH